ncbi:hypothetical protein Taro_047509 [Colocasia esculenta]|uniref:Auxin-responsive protein n=1 Tax=Colocasia esculenta TaxID=4460 RepID=A0A843X772_COLES|nr:hypothetical protein [Colocasia esculenta]
MVAGGGGGGGVDYCLGFEETELRLGLPGGNGETAKGASSKRGFSETIDLKLKLTTAAADPEDGGSCGDAAAEKLKRAAKLKEIIASETAADPEKPPAPKAQVVGWPPVRSFRKNILSVKPASKEDEEKPGAVAANAAFVKVSMDGAPYLRKVDLKMYSSYQELSLALEKMFGSFTSGKPLQPHPRKISAGLLLRLRIRQRPPSCAVHHHMHVGSRRALQFQSTT